MAPPLPTRRRPSMNQELINELRRRTGFDFFGPSILKRGEAAAAEHLAAEQDAMPAPRPSF